MPPGARSSEVPSPLYVPAIEVTRGSVVESVHAAAIAVVDADGAPRARLGSTDHPVFMRSAVKPLQAMAVVESGACERFGLGPEEIAVMCGSHGSERAQVAAVGRILEKCGLDDAALQCGTHTPFNRDVADAYRRAGRAPGPIDHNCSGKHAGMLAAALAGGHDPATYLVPDHPVQRRVLEGLADMAGCPADRLVIETDGCGVPAIGLGLDDAARAFARLAGAGAGRDVAGDHADAARRVVAAMRAHPEMIAGTGMTDTWINGRPRHGLVAKRGAEGVQCLGFVKDGTAWGVAAKIADGNNMRARIAMVRELLRQLDLIDDEDFDSLDDAGYLVIRNDAGRRVGEVRAAFTLPRA